jgi:AcrR family transcriptional regulator
VGYHSLCSRDDPTNDAFLESVMPTNHTAKKPPRQSRRGTSAATRERLLAAALDLLHRGGETAVTTVSVTRAAGITQSAFYRHFANIEDCLAEAAESVTSEIRIAIAESRRKMYARGPGTGENLERDLRKLLQLSRRQRRIMQLVIRFRSDPRSLNGVMYRFTRGIVRDLADQLMGRAAEAGLRPDPVLVEALADYIAGACSSAIDAYLAGRGPSIDEAARILASFCTGARRAVFETLRTTK